MSNNTKIFSEAIAEAKAIRETAMANAKLALEEAFAPRIQEMMSDKLEALAEEEMEEGYEKDLDEGNMENMDEISLEELLSELEGLEEGKEEMEENTIAEAEADEEEMEAGEEEMEAGEDDLELEEILAEIESLEESDEEEMEEGLKDLAKKAGEKIKSTVGPGGSMEKWIDKTGEKMKKAGIASPYGANHRISEELEEAMNTIATLRSELNEVNLLNAKLLYVNKLFKAKNLNESQKVKVINAFDRAETVREAKNVFDTLSESLSTEKVKSQIKESLSFASKAAGVADRQPIVEGNDFVARMQKLAGII